MCPQCHYLTEILLEIASEHTRLRKELLVTSDAEQVVNLHKALADAAKQIQIAQARMEDHVAADHERINSFSSAD